MEKQVELDGVGRYSAGQYDAHFLILWHERKYAAMLVVAVAEHGCVLVAVGHNNWLALEFGMKGHFATCEKTIAVDMDYH